MGDMTRWHITIILAVAATLCAFECQMSVPGEPIAALLISVGA